jgi:hypothetical protein
MEKGCPTFYYSTYVQIFCIFPANFNVGYSRIWWIQRLLPGYLPETGRRKTLTKGRLALDKTA